MKAFDMRGVDVSFVFFILDVLKTILIWVLDPLPKGVPGEGPDSCFPQETRRFWAVAGPDPGGNSFLILILAPSAARS